MSEHVYEIRVVYAGKSRTLLLHEGVPTEEITGVLQATFGVHPVAGLRDARGTYYPLAILTTAPSFGHLKSFELVVGTGSQLYDAKHNRGSEEPGLDLEDVRDLIGLHQHSVEDVFEAFAEGANEEGLLTLKVFQKCFAQLIALNSHSDYFDSARTEAVVAAATVCKYE